MSGGERGYRSEKNMVASSAFKELSAVLARLESGGADVRHAAVDEDLSGTDGDVTAELSVGVPILDEAETSEEVSITAVDATVEDGRVAVDLTVTVSGDDTTTAADTPELGAVDSGTEHTTQTVPAYKDPDALRAAYERYETFPEMTEALGVDVTSETVRRHMVAFDIHDPDDAGTGYADTTVRDQVQRTDDDATAATSAEESATGSDPVAGNAVTDGGNATVAESPPESTCAPRPVTDVLAEAPAPSGEVGHAGFELPESVTVGDLTDAINRSRTVHELAHEVGVHQSTAREFLQAFDLIHFVSHPLAAEQVSVSPEEVQRRLGPAAQ